MFCDFFDFKFRLFASCLGKSLGQESGRGSQFFDFFNFKALLKLALVATVLQFCDFLNWKFGLKNGSVNGRWGRVAARVSQFNNFAKAALTYLLATAKITCPDYVFTTDFSQFEAHFSCSVRVLRTDSILASLLIKGSLSL